MDNMREIFYDRLDNEAVGQTKQSNAIFLTSKTEKDIIATLERPQKTCQKDYRLERKYHLIDFGGTKKIARHGADTVLVAKEDLFDRIHEAHIRTGHSGRDILYKELRRSFYNVTQRSVSVYLRLCEACQLKQKKVKKGVVVKPIISNYMNSRCQVDLIDMQSNADREYRFIMVYQDHLTKFVCLRPLKTKRAEEVADHLLHIFSDKGAPLILQSDNGREFANKLVERVVSMWPECKLVHGKPRHSQSQGSVERANRDLEDILAMWQRDNHTSKWADGLWFVQYAKNRRFHSGIGRSPYEAMYGRPITVGLEGLPKEVTYNITTEEELMSVFADGEEENKDPCLCVSCQQTTSGGHKCAICGQVCHAIQPCSTARGDEEEGYGAAVVCCHCHTAEKQKEHRTAAKRRQEKQAERMLEMSAKRFKAAELGQSVRVSVPDVDRAKNDPRNVLAVVLNMSEDGFYRLGTKSGVLKQLYARNQFDPCLESFISIADVPTDKEVSLRQAATAQSEGNGQGFQKCNCRQTNCCTTNRCNCKAKGLLCNSKCHEATSCSNK